jgi:hypothetical protein
VPRIRHNFAGQQQLAFRHQELKPGAGQILLINFKFKYTTPDRDQLVSLFLVWTFPLLLGRVNCLLWFTASCWPSSIKPRLGQGD